jgi:hypothetical protein
MVPPLTMPLKAVHVAPAASTLGCLMSYSLTGFIEPPEPVSPASASVWYSPSGMVAV